MEPRARGAVWAEKLLVSTLLMALFVAAALGTMRLNGALPATGGVLVFPVAWACSSLAAGPLLATITRSTLAGAGLAFLGALAQVVLVALLMHWGAFDWGEDEKLMMRLSACWSVATLAMGFVVWRRLEPGRTGGRWMWASTPGAALRLIGTAPRRGAPWGNLARRLIARHVGTAILSLVLQGLLAVDVWMVLHGVERGMLPSIWDILADVCLPLLLLLPVLLVPLLAGLVSGEDRRQRTEHLHLTLPITALNRDGTSGGLGLVLSLLLGALPPCIAYAALLGYSHFFLAQPVGPFLMAIGAVFAFALGWFSTLASRTQVGAALLASSLITMSFLLWVTIQNWAAPWIAAQLKGVALNPAAAWAAPTWSVWDLSVALAPTPGKLALYLATTVAPPLMLLGWILRVARHQHVGRVSCILAFLVFLVLFALGQLAVSLPYCLAALRGV
jgi:hypothetical protein